MLFSFSLAAFLLYLTLRDLDWAAFWNALRFGHYEFLLVIIPLASINFFIRAVRWRVLLQAETKVPVGPIFWANMVGYMGNAYLPARAGELLRSVFLGRQRGLGTSFVLGTALAERILDAVILLIIGSVCLLWQGQISSVLGGAVRVVVFAAIAGLVLIIVAPFQEKWILRFLGLLPLPVSLYQKIVAQIARLMVGMRSLQSSSRLLTFFLLTLVIWLVDGVGNTIGVRIVGQSLNLGQALILLAALGLSSAIPSTPGYVGVYQFVAVIVLVPFGFSRAEALAYILISQALSLLLVSFWGLLGLWRIKVQRRLS